MILARYNRKLAWAVIAATIWSLLGLLLALGAPGGGQPPWLHAGLERGPDGLRIEGRLVELREDPGELVLVLERRPPDGRDSAPREGRGEDFGPPPGGPGMGRGPGPEDRGGWQQDRGRGDGGPDGMGPPPGRDMRGRPPEGQGRPDGPPPQGGEQGMLPPLDGGPDRRSGPDDRRGEPGDRHSERRGPPDQGERRGPPGARDLGGPPAGEPGWDQRGPDHGQRGPDDPSQRMGGGHPDHPSLPPGVRIEYVASDGRERPRIDLQPGGRKPVLLLGGGMMVFTQRYIVRVARDHVLLTPVDGHPWLRDRLRHGPPNGGPPERGMERRQDRRQDRRERFRDGIEERREGGDMEDRRRDNLPDNPPPDGQMRQEGPPPDGQQPQGPPPR